MKNKSTIYFKFSLVFSAAVLFWLINPKAASAATLYLSPAGGNFTVGATITVTVKTDTASVAVNTAEATVNFSANNLELVSVKQGSTFYLTSPGSPAKSASTAFFSGGLPTPGYNGTGGVLGTMTFKAKAAGSASLSISAGQVLLNDGKGTNAYTGSSGAKYTINQPIAAVTVSSDTHPIPDTWYPKSDLNLSWNQASSGSGYSFELDQKPDTVPDNTIDSPRTTTSKQYTDLKDGTWYFHIKAGSGSNFGATSHFRIQIDTQKPLLFDIKLSNQNDLNDVSRTPTIIYEGKDETSGIDHYDVYLDGVVVQQKAESPYTFAKLENGPHVIRVVAFDKAGNDRKAELPIIVQGPPVVGFFQRNLQVPIYILLIINFIILILFAIFIWLLRRRKKTLDQSPQTSGTGFEAQLRQALFDLTDLRNENYKNMFELKKELNQVEASVAKLSAQAPQPSQALPIIQSVPVQPVPAAAPIRPVIETPLAQPQPIAPTRNLPEPWVMPTIQAPPIVPVRPIVPQVPKVMPSLSLPPTVPIPPSIQTILHEKLLTNGTANLVNKNKFLDSIRR